MKKCLAVGCAIGLIAALVPGQTAKSGLARDWRRVPVSNLQKKIAAACVELCSDLTEATFVVTPFQCNASKVNTWRIGTFVHRLVQRELRGRGYAVLDAAPFLADLRQPKGRSKSRSNARSTARSKRKRPPLKYTAKLIARAAETTGASIVVVGKCRFGNRQNQITLRFYGGSPRRRLASRVVNIATRELDLLANTPATNRRVIEWVEQNIGKKIDRGECWDLANRAFVSLGIRRAGGSTVWGELIAPGDAILPGDIIQWNRKETGGRHHTVVVYGIGRRGTIKVLHQNWAGGAERGRVVASGSYSPSGLKGARVYRPISPEQSR